MACAELCGNPCRICQLSRTYWLSFKEGSKACAEKLTKISSIATATRDARGIRSAFDCSGLLLLLDITAPRLMGHKLIGTAHDLFTNLDQVVKVPQSPKQLSSRTGQT